MRKVHEKISGYPVHAEAEDETYKKDPSVIPVPWVMFVAFVLSVLFLLPAAAETSGWWDAAWANRQRIYIDASALDSDLDNFPLGLRLRAGEFDPDLALPDGADVRVVQNGAALDQELVRWSPDLAELNVRVPHIAAGTPGQYVDLYYGNPNAAAAPAGELWAAPYEMVLHLDGNLDNEASDKIVEAVNATVDDAGLLLSNPESYLSYTPTVSDNLTVSVRFRIDGGQPTVQTLASGVGSDGKDWFNFALKIPSIVHTNSASQGRLVPELNPEGVSLNEWHSASVAYDSAAGTRTICIDGKILAKDHYLPGPMHLESIHIGRGVLHFDPWQVVGRMDEVRIATVARSDSWLRAETAGLAEDNVFVAIGPIEAQNGPAPGPGKVALLAPKDNLEVRKREGVLLEWRPAAGAETYTLVVTDAATGAVVNSYDVGAATRYLLAPDGLEGHALRWTVAAKSQHGESQAREARQLTFYDWKETAMAEPPDINIAPALQFARDAEYDFDGYLRGRIDRVIDQYLTMLPVTSPAVLQVFRDRDKRPVRDPLVPWAGEFAGKYLTCAQLTWRLTQDAELKTVIDQFVRDLIDCQGDDGYLGPFPEADRLVGGNWDVWGHYHCMLGLMFYYEDTGYTPALEVCEHAADLLFETFGPGGPTLINDGAGGQMNMAVCHGLMLLYEKTGVERYLDLAKYIVHEAWNEPGAGEYLRYALDGRPLIEFPQHRWEAIHDWQALAELYWLTGDEDYRRAFEHIWHSALNGDRHNTGGVTSGEGFTGSAYHEGAIETCCTVAWIAMSVDMLRMTGDARVADEIEWSTFNSALGAIPHAGRACAYNVPMNGVRVFGVELPWQAPKGGPDLNCCAVNANRPLGMISQWALMKNDAGLTLNFYGPGEMAATLPSGNRVAIAQNTAYPTEHTVTLIVSPDKAEAFALQLRIPEWSRETTVSVNGKAVEGVTPGAYLTLDRTWQQGETVEIAFDFSLRVWSGAEGYAGQVAVYRGPLLLAYDARYNDVNPGELPEFDWRTLEWKSEPWESAIDPWLFGNLSDSAGHSIAMVDLSSAGQTGNHYRSWLPAADAPAPAEGITSDKVFTWVNRK